MKSAKKMICKTLSCPFAVLGMAGLISALALIAALASEIFWGLEPCIMCVYQRIPFLAVIIFAVIGLLCRHKENIVFAMIGLSGVSFLINSIVAFYHTGIEQKWWASAVEGCAVPNLGDASEQTILENILSAPTARCDEIPWSDPILSLSMANYNVIFCFGLFIVCGLSLVCTKQQIALGNSCSAHSGKNNKQ